MLHKSTKIIATLSIAFLIVSVVGFGVFFTLISKQKTTYAEKSLALAQAQSRQETVKSLLETLNETKEDRTSLIARIVKEEEVIDLLSRIESLGRDERVALTTNALTVEPLNEMFETLVVKLSAEGSYTAVVRTLTLLEYLPYQSTMYNVLLMSEGEMWKGTFELRVTKAKKI
jgi:Tfp pilus assembly protein PilO